MLHPLLVPFAGICFLFNCCETLVPYAQEARNSLLVLIFIFTCAFPFISIYLLYSTSFISGFDLENRRERLVVMLIVTIYYTMLCYLFIQKIGVGMQISIIALSLALTIAWATLVSTVVKLSPHALSVSALLGLFLALQVVNPELNVFYPFIAALVASGLVMTIRLARQQRPSEVYSGFAVGFLCSYLVIWLFA